MKHEAYKFENLNPAQHDGPMDIERYVIEARLQHDIYIADSIVRGVRRLARSFDNGIVKPVRNWKGNPTVSASS